MNMHGKKGFFLTFDGLIAIFILTILLSLLFFSPFPTETGEYNARDFAISLANTLEQHGLLQKGLNNDSELIAFLFSLPSDVCVGITIYDSQGIEIKRLYKPSCNYNNNVQLYRTFIDENANMYYAKIEVGGEV